MNQVTTIHSLGSIVFVVMLYYKPWIPAVMWRIFMKTRDIREFRFLGRCPQNGKLAAGPSESWRMRLKTFSCWRYSFVLLLIPIYAIPLLATPARLLLAANSVENVIGETRSLFLLNGFEDLTATTELIRLIHISFGVEGIRIETDRHEGLRIETDLQVAHKELVTVYALVLAEAAGAVAFKREERVE